MVAKAKPQPKPKITKLSARILLAMKCGGEPMTSRQIANVLWSMGTKTAPAKVMVELTKLSRIGYVDVNAKDFEKAMDKLRQMANEGPVVATQITPRYFLTKKV